jgi:hypothetical protein
MANVVINGRVFVALMQGWLQSQSEATKILFSIQILYFYEKEEPETTGLL